MKTLTTDEIFAAIPEGWEYDATSKSIAREFVCKNFLGAVAFVSKIADIAEGMDHHPDILIHSYKKVNVTLSTHSAGGVTELDITQAGKINSIER